ncbi:glycosyltransferase [Flavobacteriaceae bacterium]|nr:glycosyltransferase [Flavobacteriaceae bacterium]
MISILIPFKNTSKFLTDCLLSIINQSYTKWELIIIDDHSIDQSYSIVEEFANNDPRIKLYKNIGSGIIDALQLAYKQSKGEFITRMDSDDLMSSNKLEVLHNALIKHGKRHVSLGMVKYFSDLGINEGFLNYETWLNKLTIKGLNFTEIYKECPIASPCWMLHREDFDKCGGFDSLIYPEDYDLAFRMYKFKIKCIQSSEIIHYWRDYANRSSRIQENYSQKNLLKIKLFYFLNLDYNINKTLVLWGAGKKGKFAANFFIKHKVNFTWICDNPNKIGKNIYGVKLQSFEFLESISNPQSIITVANPKAQNDIKEYLNHHKMKPMIDYIFFC